MSAGDMATPRQLTALHTILSSLGVQDRDHRLAIVSHIVGCPIASTKDPMRAEAGSVMNYLDTLLDADEIAAFVSEHRPVGVPA